MLKKFLDKIIIFQINYNDKKIREIWMKMVNTFFLNSTEDMINQLQNLRGKTKLKFYKNLSYYYDEKILEILNLRKLFFQKCCSRY